MTILTKMTLAAGAMLFSLPNMAADLTFQVYKPNQDAIFPVTSVLVSGAHKSILFDAQFSVADGQALVDIIKKSHKSLAMIYITAGDPDYYFGLQPLLAAFPDTQVFASTAIVEHIKQTKDAKLAYWGPILGEQAPTKITVPEPLDSTKLVLEGHTIEVKEAGTHQAYLWEPSSKTVFGGVSVSSGMHIWTADTQTPEARGAWVDSLQKLNQLNPTRVIPGHFLGDLLPGSEAVDFSIKYLVHFEKALKESNSSTQVIDKMKRSYPNLAGESDLELSSKVNTGEMAW